MGSYTQQSLPPQGVANAVTLETTASATGLASNLRRIEMRIKNRGINPLYVKRGAGCTTSVDAGYEWALPPGLAQDDGLGGEVTIGTTWAGVVSVAGTNPRYLLSVITYLLLLCFVTAAAYGQNVTVVNPPGLPVPVKSIDKAFRTQVGVLTNATVQDYVYFSVTLTNFFSRTNGMGTIAGVGFEGGTNGDVYLHLSGAPWSATTNGAIWNMALDGQGATNAVGGVPIKLTTSVKRGTNYMVGASSLNYPVLNLWTNRNLYAVGTFAGSTAVSNYPASGTNYNLYFFYWED